MSQQVILVPFDTVSVSLIYELSSTCVTPPPSGTQVLSSLFDEVDWFTLTSFL